MTDFPKDLREGALAEVDFNSPITKDQLDGTQRPRVAREAAGNPRQQERHSRSRREG